MCVPHFAAITPMLLALFSDKERDDEFSDGNKVTTYEEHAIARVRCGQNPCMFQNPSPAPEGIRSRWSLSRRLSGNGCSTWYTPCRCALSKKRCSYSIEDAGELEVLCRYERIFHKPSEEEELTRFAPACFRPRPLYSINWNFWPASGRVVLHT
ncbi:hypothetical protein EDD15DRAFT_126202 [Pisolithus albus]|nr:hypothetical protein EDD15DRAFT_126202 [Pisolithus albus]